jgi:hypothetical protein
MQITKLALALLAVSAFGGPAQARTKVIEDQQGSLKTLASIGDVLDSPDHHPVHILYVHGISQIGAGDSALLRQSICTKLNLCDVSDWKNAGIEFADKGEFAPGLPPPALAYLGSPIWNNPAEWHAADPFVVHWVVHLRHHPAILVLDEINWWPLVLALKCRHVEAPEAYLAGPDRSLLQVCSNQSAQNPGGLGRFYPWISADEAATLSKIPPHGALANRALKDDLLDWGLSDALLAVGPLGGILRDGMRQLMAESAAFDPNGAASSLGSDARERYNWRAQLQQGAKMDQEFIGVTHSLGSYLLFNTLNLENTSGAAPDQSAEEAAREAAEDSAVQYIFERTSQIYFFANQIAMLEITNLEIAPSAPASEYQSRGLAAPLPVPSGPAANFRALVARWEQFHSNFQEALHPNDESAREKVQVEAWSDPSDVFTWRVPRIGDLNVVNLYVQNGRHWFGLFESPAKAHGDYAENKAVLKVVFENTANRPAGN